ncbi:undecaprenyl/decaprenyl-phosphate alpha-N-acetylglucosaminyl 1-phosphate transferase [Ilyomonas limi]|uniref:Undecaprenyl/decaprenyl-phosphate alpha-N-acetylglucosaminyl 1-phosphate transferase n=1 Tax=Ilyomonas limi TaxID=2575867 RepID=A0A4U3KZY5_9BACT|nr:MraY family glycosyltransferase [Ilyomonas limi]TKK67469.1 undecaprenyl/decaprenyl-phosphate alpha-N-acetylglucosaminyl 1-phosphate transferase [Ilyomonas limi]
MIYAYLFFLAALFMGACFTWLVRLYALKMNIVNKPNPIVPQHVKPIAYLGGVGIMTGAIIMIVCSYQYDIPFHKLQKPFPSVAPLIAGAIGYLAWGVYDDLKQLKPLPKFLGQLVLATMCVALGIQTTLFNIGWIDFLFSVFWIVLIVNALNFTDVCDGLVGTICVVSFFIIGFLKPELRIFCFLIAGTTAGFLFFNLPRASIFLGDAGSHLLGFLIAAIGIFGSQHATAIDAAAWLMLIASVPLFELLFITSVRIKKGLPWWKGSPDHFSLRLQKGGFTRIQINIIAGGISTLVVSIACFFSAFEIWVKVVSLVIIFLMYAVAWKFLLKWEVTK